MVMRMDVPLAACGLAFAPWHGRFHRGRDGPNVARRSASWAPGWMPIFVMFAPHPRGGASCHIGALVFAKIANGGRSHESNPHMQMWPEVSRHAGARRPGRRLPRVRPREKSVSATADRTSTR